MAGENTGMDLNIDKECCPIRDDLDKASQGLVKSLLCASKICHRTRFRGWLRTLRFYGRNLSKNSQNFPHTESTYITELNGTTQM